MSESLKHITLSNFTTQSGYTFKTIKLSYQRFGQPLSKAPVVLVNHALTGNSNVSGASGWWKDIVGKNKIINTNTYAVLAFNIPGNGYDGTLIDNYKDLVARDIAFIFLKGLEALKINRLFAIIGGSLGGGIGWEMASENTRLTKHLIPIATDWKSTDWMVANCQIQEQILKNSSNPVHDARMHAMLCYRTPQSFKKKFNRTKHEALDLFNVESWLLNHGEKLQQRFQVSAYKLVNQLLKTIDATKNRPQNILDKIEANIHVVAIDSDLFFTAEENKETVKTLAHTKPNITYHEISSEHGHDAFLIEYKQLETILQPIFNPNGKAKRMKVLKFGGKSLANGKGLQKVISIIEEKKQQGERITVVVSARGDATNQLETILEKAAQKQSYKKALQAFKAYQEIPVKCDLFNEFKTLDKLFEGVSLLGDYSLKIKDEILAQGELISAKTITALLTDKNIKAQFVDTRTLIQTDDAFGNAHPIEPTSRNNIIEYFSKIKNDVIPIVTGFIAANRKGETTTLGRNGSNFSAALLANYLEAEELQNYTHVNGIYTADPNLVKDAKKIETLTFNEANEIANFGTTILHAKTIIPLLEKNINLRILNTFSSDNGTLITAKAKSEGIKTLAVLDDVALINLEGRGLLGKSGVDARIFKALAEKDISVSIISQGSSERGVGLVIKTNTAEKAVAALEKEFKTDIQNKDVSSIEVVGDVAVISIIGLDLSAFHKPYNALIKNQIVPILFNNTVTGKNVSLVVLRHQLHSVLNVVHGEIFGISKKINIAIFGHGLVGGELINQILKSAKTIESEKGVKLNIFAVANSKKALLNSNGVSKDWKTKLSNNGVSYTANDVIAYAKQHHLVNLIAVDNTASRLFVDNYLTFINNGFDLVSSNKIANTISLDFYNTLRETLKKNQKRYLYETNVGAGLPLIDTIRLLHLSGENITRIRGVFSGSLSFLFNKFSEADLPFSTILKQAMEQGYTEPDAREDLSGNDVARKLLILARELKLVNEMSDIAIQSLIPEHLTDVPLKTFLKQLSDFDQPYQDRKSSQNSGHVLRYIGDLSGNLADENGAVLEVKLTSVPKNSPLGALRGSDSIFEIYTESYGKQPLVIQGAGAGAQVTARGVFGDILRITENYE